MLFKITKDKSPFFKTDGNSLTYIPQHSFAIFIGQYGASLFYDQYLFWSPSVGFIHNGSPKNKQDTLQEKFDDFNLTRVCM